MASQIEVRQQAVTGVVTPEGGEAIIRTAWPSVAAYPMVATLGRKFMLSIVLAPLAWLMLAGLYFRKILPFMATRYQVTNRRVMILSGLKLKPSREVPLADIDDVRLVEDDNSQFYRAANVEIVSGDIVVLDMKAVADPEVFRQAILNACTAWVPGKAAKWITFLPAKPEENK